MDQVPGGLEEYFQKYERVRTYWEVVQQTEEAHVVTDYGKSWSFRFMITHGVPFKCMGLKLGILRVPELPEHIEQRIEAAYGERAREYYGEATAEVSGGSDSVGEGEKGSEACC